MRIKHIIGLVLLGYMVCFTGCESTSAGSLSEETNPRPPSSNVASLRPGDTVIVSLQSVPDPAEFQYQVDEEGVIRLRYIGPVMAAGKTASELANTITQAYLEKDIYKHVDISVTLAERFIYVGGEVRNPGPILWTNDMTLLKAVTAAGGFTLYAKEGAVSLSREEENFSLDASLAKEKPSEDIELLPGDSLFVPRSAF